MAKKPRKPPAKKPTRRNRPAKSKGDWKPAFLASFRNNGIVRAAAEAAGISRKTAFAERNKDEAFAADWDDAIEDACDLIEARALAKVNAGDDAWMLRFLRAHRAKWREQTQVALTGGEGPPLVVETIVRSREEAQAVLARLPEAG